MLDSITMACQVYGHNPIMQAEMVSVRCAGSSNDYSTIQEAQPALQ